MLQWPSSTSDFLWLWIGWRRAEIGTSFNIKNPRECWKSKQNDWIKQAIEYWGNFWGSEHLLWFCSKQFNNRFEDEVSECEICSTCFDGRTNATAFVNFIGVARSCHFRFQLFRKCRHGKWNLGLWLWSWDQGSEFSVEVTQFFLCEKSVSSSNIKVMMFVFFDLDGIVWAEFVPRNTMVNSEYYKGLLECLRNDVNRKRPEKWANYFILHHDNPLCHTSLLVRQFLSNKNITVCPHPPYSPDLAPCDFWLFPKVKMTMKGKRFELIQDIDAATTADY